MKIIPGKGFTNVFHVMFFQAYELMDQPAVVFFYLRILASLRHLLWQLGHLGHPLTNWEVGGHVKKEYERHEI